MGQAQQQNRFTIALMPNIASVLKAEIVRVARKKVRNEIAGLRKSAAAYRSEIAALKRRTQTLELELRRLNKSVPKRPENPVLETTATKVRFSAKGLVTLRQRLALSALRTRIAGGRVRTVGLQLGNRRSASSRQTSAFDRRVEGHGQEGSGIAPR